MSLTHWKVDGKHVPLSSLTDQHLSSAIHWARKKVDWLNAALGALRAEQERRLQRRQAETIAELDKLEAEERLYGVPTNTAPEAAGLNALHEARDGVERLVLLKKLSIATEELESVAKGGCKRSDCACCRIDSRDAERALQKMGAIT